MLRAIDKGVTVRQGGTRSLLGRPGNEQIQSVGVERLAPAYTAETKRGSFRTEDEREVEIYASGSRDAYHLALF